MYTPSSEQIAKAYDQAKEAYAQLGVDTEAAMNTLSATPISLHCWQGDDVGGFESPGSEIGAGLAATGNYPGKARTPAELRQDAEKAFSLIPGKHRFNLHAFYSDLRGRKVERNELEPKHFEDWIVWAEQQGLKLDFNPTYFSHPKAADGFTLSSADEGIRKFWVEHGICCRKIGEAMGRELGTPCVVNVWIPDGYKDLPADRWAPRARLKQSLDEMFAEDLNPEHMRDAIECKLFGIGSESYVTGSHEFYLAYGVANRKMITLDAGHFHPTEGIADKLSAVLTFMDEVLLHVSRGVRWDSDHVVILNDDLRLLAEELVRGGVLDRVHLGLDFFDASINRLAAWVIGTRAMLKSLLLALLQPTQMLKDLELSGDFTARLAIQEDLKTMPAGAVWDRYCEQQGVPAGMGWLEEVRGYEERVLARR